MWWPLATDHRGAPDADPPVAACRLVRRAEIGPARPGQASVVVATHNDGANIGPLVRRLLDEPQVAELIVVASGCDDDTVPNAIEAAADDPRVAVWVEDARSGKVPAVNLGLRQARAAAIVLVSGDVLPEPGAVGHLLRGLDEPGVGMVGGRPVPAAAAGLAGHAAWLLWDLHHRAALRSPKLGEMVAMRAGLVAGLPMTSVDEAALQAAVVAAGWSCAYVPEAVVGNHTPTTVRHYLRQRRRVHAGHLWVRRRYDYAVPSLSPLAIFGDLFAAMRERRELRRPRALVFTAASVALEATARVIARADYLLGKEAHVWKVVESAKAPPGRTNGVVAGPVRRVAPMGVAPPVAGERDGERELPVQLQVRHVQRVRAQGRRADARRVDDGVPQHGTSAGLDDLQRGRALPEG